MRGSFSSSRLCFRRLFGCARTLAGSAVSPANPSVRNAQEALSKIDHPLSQGARRRKAVFASPDEARTVFASRRVFSAWDPRCLDDYVAGGLRVQPGAGGLWELKCAPQDEASIYPAAARNDLWERLSTIRCPVLLVAGARSDTHPEPLLREMHAQFKSAQLLVVPDASHFVPMERPESLARAIVNFTAASGLDAGAAHIVPQPGLGWSSRL